MPLSFPPLRLLDLNVLFKVLGVIVFGKTRWGFVIANAKVLIIVAPVHQQNHIGILLDGAGFL
jgi:hypothetical protein